MGFQDEVSELETNLMNSPEHRALLRQHRAPQISFQSALANASRAASNAAPADPDPAPPVALTPSQRNTAFVTTLYRDVLGRDPDAGGLNFWVNRLVAGTSRDQGALGFWNSVERRALMKRHRAPQISLGSALTDASRAANNA